jgi:hypothetical protein
MTQAIRALRRVLSILGVAALCAGGGSALLASPALAGGVDPSSGLLSAAVYNLTPYTWTWWLRVVCGARPHRRRSSAASKAPSRTSPCKRHRPRTATRARRPPPEPALPHERRSALGECITPVTSARDALAEWPVGWRSRRLACGVDRR